MAARLARPSGLIALGALLVSFLGSRAACEEPAPKAPAAKAPASKEPAGKAKEVAEGVRWRRTYAEALREARLRNVPVLVTRHKDT